MILCLYAHTLILAKSKSPENQIKQNRKISEEQDQMHQVLGFPKSVMVEKLAIGNSSNSTALPWQL